MNAFKARQPYAPLVLGEVPGEGFFIFCELTKNRSYRARWRSGLGAQG